MGLYEQLFSEYSYHHSTDDKKFGVLKKQLAEQSDEQLIDRKNFVGHFTASAFVISRSTRHVVLIHHNFLKKYLQPGGHIELGDDSPLAAAQRELREETDISTAELTYHYVTALNKQVPFHLDVQFIPENPKKQEPSHYHYDLQYLFLSDNDLEVTINQEEAGDFEWIAWDDFRKMPDFREIAKELEYALAPSPERFLSNIAQPYDNVSCIAIQHIVKNSVPFIKTLQGMFGDNLAVYAKPKSIDDEAWSKLEAMGISLQIARRDWGDELDRRMTGGKKVVCLDIGGYFAELAQRSDLPIIGIVEDTENGHRRYEAALPDLKYPVFSVARNRLKDNEDLLVGAGIVFGTDYILRKDNNLLTYMRTACIGYGKIGRGICSRLRMLNNIPTVIEKNPIRSVEATRDGNAVELEADYSNKDVIFCATGAHSLDIHNFRSIKNGAFIVVATSSEDELALDYLTEEYQKIEISSYVTKYRNDQLFLHSK